jgi:MSHA biogenesis protein MshP
MFPRRGRAVITLTPDPWPLAPARGFALPAAIFLLVVLGGLAAWLTSLTQATLAENNLELEGERAYQAARAGLEAGIHQAAQAGAGCAQIAQTVSFSAASSLARFTATVTCQQYTADEAGATVTLFQVTSVACNQASAGACPNAAPSLEDYAERHLRATVTGG